MHLLYVEDDSGLAQSVAAMLQSSGHSCDTTRLGERAVHLAQTRHYDLILLDVMLPDIDGFDVIDRLRSAGNETPYLLQSGLIERDSALALGVGEYLVKPFTKEELLMRIEAVQARAEIQVIAAPQSMSGPQTESAAATVQENRRQHRRFRTAVTARLEIGLGMDGKIIDMSHSGAALRLSDDAVESCPDTFVLRLKTGQLYRCQVCWRYRNKLGVRFLR